MKEQNKSRTFATIAVFAALSVFLNISPFKIPAPFAPYLIYQIWEIPIVAAFLLYGPKIGLIISLINTIILIAVFPGALPTGPFYNLAALLSMLLGIYSLHMVVTWSLSGRRETILIAFSTALGITTRVLIMTVFNYLFLQQPPPIGFGLPMSAVVATLPIIGFFNATLALYSIPLGYFIARTIVSSIKIKAWYIRNVVTSK